MPHAPMTTGQDIHELMATTMLTSVEIIERLGIAYGTFYEHVNRTDSEARDARIAIYEPVGHDGSRHGDRCQRCSIIMLKEYSSTPPGWGEFQRATGSVCSACMSDLFGMYPEALYALITSGCAYCDCTDVGIFFLQEGPPGMVAPDPMQAIPLCKDHRRNINEKTKDALLRDYYDRVDIGRLFTIVQFGRTSPMPVWDILCPNCGARYMPEDLSLGDEFWQCGVCDMSDNDRIGVHCPECCPADVQ